MFIAFKADTSVAALACLELELKGEIARCCHYKVSPCDK